MRLVEEFGVIETIHTAKPDAVEFVQQEIPERYFPPGRQADDWWGTAFYGNLIHSFLEEIIDPTKANTANFAQSAPGSGDHQRRGTFTPHATMGRPAAGG